MLAVIAVLGVGRRGARTDRLDVRRREPPVAVSLVQGNVAQDLKFDPDFRSRTFDLYADLVAQRHGTADRAPGKRVADVRRRRARVGSGRRSAHRRRIARAIFSSVSSRSQPPLPGCGMPRYYNSVVTLGAGAPQLYRKRHLVPFGETIPLEAVVGWFMRLDPGDSAREPVPRATPISRRSTLPARRSRVDICYEDAFGADIRPQARDATLLVNVTNDAWYGHSLAAEQHNQIAAMRALETGRPLLRATNTGITSAIDHRRPRGRAPAVVHARHPRSRGHGPAGRDPLCPRRRRARCAARGAGTRGDRVAGRLRGR